MPLCWLIQCSSRGSGWSIFSAHCVSATASKGSCFKSDVKLHTALRRMPAFTGAAVETFWTWAEQPPVLRGEAVVSALPLIGSTHRLEVTVEFNAPQQIFDEDGIFAPSVSPTQATTVATGTLVLELLRPEST
jgi:hypothetical protein